MNASWTASRASSSLFMMRRATAVSRPAYVRTRISYAVSSPSRREDTSPASSAIPIGPSGAAADTRGSLPRLNCPSHAGRLFDASSQITINLDGAVRVLQLREQLPVVVQALHGVGQQARQPARVLQFGFGHVADAVFKVLAAGVDGAHHHVVAEHEV